MRAEFQLIGEGRVFIILAGLAAAIGALADYRQFGGPAAMLLLAFALSAHGGRSETLRALTRTAALSPAVRRMAFVVAGTGWALLMALPGTITHLSVQPLLLALVTGAGAAGIAIGLAALSRSALCAPTGPARPVVRLFLDRRLIAGRTGGPSATLLHGNPLVCRPVRGPLRAAAVRASSRVAALRPKG